MVLRIAGLPVWVGPSELIAGARAVVGWTDDAVDVVAGLPNRVATLLDDVEVLVGRVSRIAERADGLVGRADGIVEEIDAVLVGVRTSVANVDQVLVDAGSLVRRIDPLLAEVGTVAGGAAALISRAGEVADGAAGLVTRAGAVAEGASEVVSRAGTVADDAGVVVTGAGAISDTASRLIGLYQPLAEKAAPLAQRFVEDFSEAELQAAIRMIDQLPQLTHHLETDIMPILVTLDRVGPDVHDLLDVLKDMRQAIQGIPGFRMLRRRGENKEAEEQD